MALAEMLEERFINLPDKHVSNLLALIKRKITNKKFDTSVLGGIGKGKWLLNFVSIEGNRLDIISLSADEILIKFLEKNILSDNKIDFSLKSELNFWGRDKSGNKAKVIKDLMDTLIVQVEITPIDKELNSYKLKAGGNITKAVLIKILKNFCVLFYSRKFIFKELELTIRSKTMVADIIMDPKEINISINLSEEELLKTFNSILFCKNLNPPCYCLYYVDVQKIKGDWTTGKREGYLIKECGSLKNKQQEKFKF